MRVSSAAHLYQVDMEPDRIEIPSPLTGFRIEITSRLAQRIDTISRFSQQVDVQSPVATVIRVTSSLSLEELR
jgi:hypothetical protein